MDNGTMWAAEMRSGKAFGRDLARIDQIISNIQSNNLNLTSAQIVIRAAIRLSDDRVSKLATPSEMARVLRMSVSAVNRLMLRLSDPNDLGLLTREGFHAGGRAERYGLSKKGMNFIDGLLDSLNDENGSQKTSNGRKYQVAEQNRRDIRPPKIRKIHWDEDNMRLTVLPIEDLLREDVQEWGQDFLSSSLKPVEISAEGAVIEFKNIGDAVYFVLRWCDEES